MARVTRSKKALLAAGSARDEDDSTLRHWPAALSPPAKKKRRGKCSQPEDSPSTSEGPCWLALDTASLERVFELLLADPNGGTAACKAAGATCKEWRQACIDVVLSDTAASRPPRPMLEDERPSISCAAAVWDGPRAEEDMEGFEASSQRCRAQARALLTTSTGCCAAKQPHNAAAAAGRRHSNAAARTRPPYAAPAGPHGAQRRQAQMATVLLPRMRPWQARAGARAGPSNAAAAIAADAQREGSARDFGNISTEGQTPRAGAAWTSPWPGLARATRAQRHRQQNEERELNLEQPPSGQGDEPDATTPMQPVRQLMPAAHLHTQPSHHAAQRSVPPSQEAPQQRRRQTRQWRQQQQLQQVEPEFDLGAGFGSPQVEAFGGRSPSANADSRSLPVNNRCTAKHGVCTHSQQPSTKQTQSCSQEPSTYARAQQRQHERQGEEEVQQARAYSAAGGVTRARNGPRAEGYRRRRTEEQHQQQRQEQQQGQGQAQPQQELEDEPATMQQPRQPARMGWDSMPGATLLRGLFSRFTSRG